MSEIFEKIGKSVDRDDSKRKNVLHHEQSLSLKISVHITHVIARHFTSIKLMVIIGFRF